MAPIPLGELKYLYLGTSRFDDDLAYYRDVLGAEEVWHFQKFGARVAAFRVAAGPLLLIADHRPAPSCLPVFAVPDLAAMVRELSARGWSPESGPFEIPDGPCYLFRDKSGNQLAVFGNVRPDALGGAYRDPGNEAAVR
ncbi:MAG TPA: VOC family protein [Myxococcaceae bacterium]|jgi:catechol 2,3-dioxygenase-like lactoylglutathione lyase family enzyme